MSLFGLLERNQAIGYLRTNCLLPDTRPKTLVGLWETAKRRADPDGDSPVGNPGNPELLDLPVTAATHLEEVKANPRFGMTIARFAWAFKLVEIDSLLAFQVHVATDRADALWAEAGASSEAASLLGLCLPTAVAHLQPGAGADMRVDPANTPEKGSVTFEGDANMRLWGHGPLGPDQNHRVYLAGIAVGEGSRFVQVARFENRLYLRNGYHRAYRIRAAGVTHMPCLLLDVTDYSQTGAALGLTFPRQHLESDNPPVVAHYARGVDVTLRGPARRIIKVSWSDQLRF